MAGADRPVDERHRLARLRELEVLDTEPEPLFEKLTQLAAHLLKTPIALVSLVDAERQWFKSRVGLGATETPREHAFCAWAIHDDAVLTVPDATEDPRFASNPLVIGEPKIRFYAGAPLLVGEGSALGTLCVIDREPRALREEERQTLVHLAAVVAEALAMRREALIAERQAQLLSAAEELAGVGHWRVDLVAQSVFWSDQVYRIHGHDPATYVPSLEQGIDAYHPDDRDMVAAYVEAAIEQREPFDFEARLVRADGMVRRVHSVGVPEIVGNRVVGVFGVFIDFTDRAELRERLVQAEKMASIGTLAAGVAHEVNNPLNFVKVNAITLADELQHWMGSSPSSRLRELAELVSEIREGVMRIEKIVGGLRVFSRRSEGRTELVELERVFVLAERLCANELRHRSRFTLEVAQPAAVQADETQLVQVAVNLIVNACHAMEGTDIEDNEVKVQIGRNGSTAFFEVSDTGSGMTDDVLRQAFTPFFTTKEQGVGTGLGLAICHGIVTSLGGTVEVETEVGKGTSFRVELPASEDPLVESDDRHPTPSRRRGRRLFVVNDDELVARSIARAVRGHDVVTFRSAKKALASLRDGNVPDVILCDLMMPEMSGAAFHRALTSIDPELAQRVVIVTGGAFSDEARDFLASGVAVVDKPIDVDDLLATIERTASRHERDGTS